VVRLLADHNANLNVVDHQGYTVLMWASHFNRKDIVALLLGKKVDTNVRENFDYMTARDLARAHGNDIVDLMLYFHEHKLRFCVYCCTSLAGLAMLVCACVYSSAARLMLCGVLPCLLLALCLHLDYHRTKNLFLNKTVRNFCLSGPFCLGVVPLIYSVFEKTFWPIACSYSSLCMMILYMDKCYFFHRYEVREQKSQEY